MIASGTLREDSVGSLTWASAPLLARRIVDDPAMFLPAEATRVLELGCGTGLVGLAAEAVLRRSEREGIPVVLSDFDPLALAQAADNARTNGLDVECRLLDWRDAVAPDAERFAVILGADLSYDMPDALVSIVDALLAVDGTFHLMTPIRSTHIKEDDVLIRTFGTAPWRIVSSEFEEAAGDADGSICSFRYLCIRKDIL